MDHAYRLSAAASRKIEGTFKGFNVIEIHQADLRLANSVIEQNAPGIGGQGPPTASAAATTPATIFVRGAQPMIVDNIIPRQQRAVQIGAGRSARTRCRSSPSTPTRLPRTVWSITGGRGVRSTGSPLPRQPRAAGPRQSPGEQRHQRHGDPRRGTDDGKRLGRHGHRPHPDQSVRPAGLAERRPQVGFDEIVIPDHHIYGGLRLQSSPNESLVVKLFGAGRLNNSCQPGRRR